MFKIYEYLFQSVYFYHTEHSSLTYMHIFVWSLVSRSSFNEFPFRLKPLWNKRTGAARHRVGKSIDSFVNGPGKSFWFQVFSSPLIESFQEGFWRFFEIVTSATVALKWQKHPRPRSTFLHHDATTFPSVFPSEHAIASLPVI